MSGLMLHVYSVNDLVGELERVSSGCTLIWGRSLL